MRERIRVASSRINKSSRERTGQRQKKFRRKYPENMVNV